MKQTDPSSRCHCAIHSCPNPFILWCFNSFSSLFPSFPAVIYSVELERHAAEWSAHSCHAAPSLNNFSGREKEVRFVLMSLCLSCLHWMFRQEPFIFVTLRASHSSERTSLNTVISISTPTQTRRSPHMTHTFCFLQPKSFYKSRCSNEI